MKQIEKLVRKNILKLQPYSSARDEYQGLEGIFLDANENPYGKWNRYPDPYQTQLKIRLSQIKGIAPEKIFVGNGSDEAIDLLFRIFCEPGTDRALAFTPSYGMYTVSAAINNVEMAQIPLTATFQIDKKSIKPYLEDERLKLIFLCSPNNPTGNLLDSETIEWLLKNFQGIVVLDEAYIDFAKSVSFISKLELNPNLVVLQTLSKARGQAALRIGFAFADPFVIDLFNKVKPPYNVSGPTQELALEALQDETTFKSEVDRLVQNRSYLENALGELPFVKKVYPSQANFLLVEVENANELYEQLVQGKIIVRNRNTLVKNCLRITVGSTKENIKLIQTLKNYVNEKGFIS